MKWNETEICSIGQLIVSYGFLHSMGAYYSYSSDTVTFYVMACFVLGILLMIIQDLIACNEIALMNDLVQIII